MLQRHVGLDIAAAAASFDTLEERGEAVDRRGDGLQSGGEYNRRHNAVLRAIHNRARLGSWSKAIRETPRRQLISTALMPLTSLNSGGK